MHAAHNLFGGVVAGADGDVLPTVAPLVLQRPGLAEAGFERWLRDRLTRYRSSDVATRSFCSACGSTLFFESTRWAGEIHIARATFEGDIDHPVQAHAFFEDRAHWWPITDGLPKLGGKTGTEPMS